MPGLAGTKQKSKEECLSILGQKIDLDNLNFLAELAVKSGINATLKSRKGLIKSFV
jgi:hypothetical protein